MRPAIDIGRRFRMMIQEEAREKNYRGRFTEEFFDNCDSLNDFRENELALTGSNKEQVGNLRISGKSPQVMLEDVGGLSIREIAQETILGQDGKPIGLSGARELFNPEDRTRMLESQMVKAALAGRMREAGAETTAMDFTMFQMLVGQLLINSTLKGYQNEDFVLSETAGVYPTELITGEVVPGVSTVLSKDTMGPTQGQTGRVQNTLLHKPGETYRQASASENYIQLPSTEEHGLIIGLDKTVVYADRTGLIAKNASEIGEELGAEKEELGLDVLLGITGPNNVYKEKYAWDSAAIQLDPYQAGSTSLNAGAYQLSNATYAGRNFPFVNDVDNNPLNNWMAFQKADIFQSKVNNPNNGRPINMGKMPTIFAPFTARFNIAQVIKAYSQWKISQASNWSPGTTVETGPNMVQDQIGDVEVKVSRLLRQRMIMSGLYGDSSPVNVPSIGGTTASGVIADWVWFYGNFREALKFSTNWNIKVTQAPVNSEAEFSQGISFRWRADYRGVWAWHKIRMIQRCNYLNQGQLLNSQQVLSQT